MKLEHIKIIRTKLGMATAAFKANRPDRAEELMMEAMEAMDALKKHLETLKTEEATKTYINYGRIKLVA